MLIAERQSRLRDILLQRGMCDLETLAGELGVSQSTVRRDVDQLEQAGEVERTHGGVIWIADRVATPGRPYAFHHRMSYRIEQKRQIARAAQKLVKPGQTILIDGGTSTFYFAEELLGRPLQIVTNSLPIANLFLNDENVELVLTGGLMYPRYGVLLGPMVDNILATIHVQTLFLSVAGIQDGAMYNQNMLLVQAERRMMEQAQEVVLLADSAKFGQQALSQLGKLTDVDIVVSDSELAEEYRQRVRDAGCELILSEIPEPRGGESSET
jgi:DeoR/GlpR family transcriptional regulator of sugar metabolism